MVKNGREFQPFGPTLDTLWRIRSRRTFKKWPVYGDEMKMAEGRGFEPPVALRLRLISSQVPLTTQPPFRSNHRPLICANRTSQQAELVPVKPLGHVPNSSRIELNPSFTYSVTVFGSAFCLAQSPLTAPFFFFHFRPVKSKNSLRCR